VENVKCKNQNEKLQIKIENYGFQNFAFCIVILIFDIYILN